MFDFLKNLFGFTDSKTIIKQREALQEMKDNCEHMLVVATNLPSGKDKDDFIAAVNKYKEEIVRFQKSIA